jgi:hypothetical protein
MSLRFRRPSSTLWKTVAFKIVEGLGKAVVLWRGITSFAQAAKRPRLMWPHHDPQFFLLLAGSFAAFLTPSAIDELIRKTRRRLRRRKLLYLKKARPLDGLQRDRPRLTNGVELRNFFRRKLTRWEIQLLEQRSHFRL